MARGSSKRKGHLPARLRPAVPATSKGRGKDPQAPAATPLLWPGRALGTFLLFLAAVSTWYVSTKVIYPFLDGRRAFVDQVWAGTMEAPYQYRLLEHVVPWVLDRLMGFALQNDNLRHGLAYMIPLFAVFAALYLLLFALLRTWVSRNAALLGVSTFAMLVPLSVTGYVEEGNFLTLLFYVVGLLLMTRRQDAWIPLLIGVATLNREQMIWLAVYHAIFLWAHGRLRERRTLVLLAASAVTWAAGYLAPRVFFGFRESQYTFALHISHNTDPAALAYAIVPLWIVQAGFLALLCVFAYRQSNRFFRLALLSLVPYTMLFFFLGNLWEMAKWLPAALILIPMAMQPVAAQWISEDMRAPK